MNAPRTVIPIIALVLIATGCATGGPSVEESATEPPGVVQFGSLPTESLGDAVASELQDVLDAVVDQGSPDVLAAVLTPDGRWSGAAGIDGPDARLAGVDDLFSIASITKVFTAALIMRLVEDGSIQLDQPLSTYLGDLEIDSNGATVLQALQMRSGIPDTTEASITEVVADPSRVWTQAEIIAEFPAPEAAPGEEYIYSNPTYKILGYVAESVTGQSLADAMRTLVLNPAGSPDTLQVQSPDSALPQPWALPTSGTRAPDDAFGVGSALPNISDATFSGAGTAMAGTVTGVADWAWQLFAGNVVSPDSLATMLTTTDDFGSGSGLDTLVGQSLPDAYGHTGSKDGYQSLLAVFPETQTVIVVFINQQDAPVDRVVATLHEALTE